MPLTPDTRALEVGCGHGIFTYHLAAAVRVHGIDVSIDDLRLNPVRDVSVMNATRLAFVDESFDVVLAHHALHHIPDFERALREMARVSRRYVVVSDLNRWNLSNRFFLAIGAEVLIDAIRPIFGLKRKTSASEALEDMKQWLPGTLEEWAAFDFITTPGPWMPPQRWELARRFAFYNRFAWESGGRALVPLKHLARWRLRRSFYGLAVDKRLVEALRPPVTLS